MIKEAIEKLVDNEDLTYEEAMASMDDIMSGDTPEALISAYLVALRMKGETVDEISGSAMGMKNRGKKLEHNMQVLEMVGTGGDKANAFNISTTSAFVAAAAGCRVAKHGNRGVSSKSGAADVLEALGANINLEPDQSRELLEKVGFCFLFAQKYHESMKYVAPVRAKLGIRTIFNILGPLTNPASATMGVIGVYDKSLVDVVAKVLIKLGMKKGMVVYGLDVLDEITPCDKTEVCEFKGNTMKHYRIDPAEYGISLSEKSDLKGGDAKENAIILKDILSGMTGPKRDAVVLNAGAEIYVAKDELTFKEAMEAAKNAIDSKAALNKMQEYVSMSNSF